jgi:NDP-sugar pyrophosphorylase family protein
LGTRLGAVTRDTPKALVPVAGRPFAHYQLEWLASEGVRDVVYCIGYNGEQIRRDIGDGARFGLNVSYCEDGDQLLGTAGALRRAVTAGLMQDGFFVLYGDSWVPIHLAPVWRASDFGRRATMTVFRNDNRWDRSNVVFESGVLKVYDKALDRLVAGMTYIDFGVSVLPRDVVEGRVPAVGHFDLARLMRDLSSEGRLAGFEVFQRFYEIGTPSGLAELETLFARTNVAC